MIDYIKKMIDKDQQNQHVFKTLRIVGMVEMYFSIMTIYDKLKASIILNGQNMKVFPLNAKIRQGCPLCHFYLMYY